MLVRSIEELDALRDECRSMVTTRAVVSGGAAVVPVPGLDIGVDVLLMVELVKAINQRFGLSVEQIHELDPKYRQIALVTITSLGTQLIGRVVTRQVVLAVLKRLGVRVASKSVAKYIPLVGQGLAATLSFGAMKLLGNAHVEDCYQVTKRLLEERERAEG